MFFMPENDPRALRLYDLKPYEHIIVTCQCGQIVQYMPGLLQRRHRVPSDTLIYDLQFRFRCSRCRAFNGFEIKVVDMRNIGDNSKPCPERIIVPKNR
jgi:hypothetical protein